MLTDKEAKQIAVIKGFTDICISTLHNKEYEMAEKYFNEIKVEIDILIGLFPEHKKE